MGKNYEKTNLQYLLCVFKQKKTFLRHVSKSNLKMTKKMKHLMKVIVHFKRRTTKVMYQMKKINIKYLSSHYSRELRISLR